MSEDEIIDPTPGEAMAKAFEMEFDMLEDGTMKIWMPIIEDLANFHGEIKTIQDFIKRKIDDHRNCKTSRIDISHHAGLLAYRNTFVECVLAIDKAIQESPL